MTALWADYSSGRPGGAALKAAGITGVIRYVGVGSAGKRINAAEYHDLVANGVQVLLVVELGINDVAGGYPAGVANATAALNDARGMGIPDSVGIAAACDEHLASSQIPTALAYVQGFRDVLGSTRTGAYGFAEFVDAVHAVGTAGWWWKCGTAPTLSESQWVTFWQRNSGQTTETINKVVVDLNAQYNNSNVTLKGLLDMELTDTINAFITPPPANPIHVGDVLAEVHCSLVLAANAPGGDTIPNRFSALDEAVARLVAPSVTLGADQLTALEAVFSTAVAGLKLSISTSDTSAIAQAVAALLGSKLSA